MRPGYAVEEDEKYMKIALSLAEKAFQDGEVPVGAVLVKNGEILARDYNRRESMHDATAHAEMLVLREAGQRLVGWRLSETTMYVTLEPCPMCSGALVLARVERLVFGAFDPKGGAAGSLYDIPGDMRLNHRLEVTSGVLENECSALVKAFFREKRS